MRPIIAAAQALAVILACAAPAAAQDYNAATNYGEVTLRPGFTPDPHMVALRAGGSIDASTRFGSCSGYITQQPDYRLYWNGDGNLNLTISAISNADVTLVVNGPNGEWYCDDDSGEDLNPLLALKPTAGRYEIWIGTYSAGQPKNAVLSISELRGF